MNSSNSIPIFAFVGTAICGTSSVTLFIIKSLAKNKLPDGPQFLKTIPFQRAKLHMFGGVGINSDYFCISESPINRIFYACLFFAFSLVPLYVLMNFMASSLPLLISIVITLLDIIVDASIILRFYRYIQKS